MTIKFPKHKCGLYLEHNVHRDYYEKVSEYAERIKECFRDPVSLQRSIDTDEIWKLQWYPETPIGFYIVCAPTLKECLAYALEVEAAVGDV